MSRSSTLLHALPDYSSVRARANSDSTLAQAIAATAELCGQAMSTSASRLLASDLAAFPRSAVLDALYRCRLEFHGALQIGEILARIEDGRPSAKDAWEMMPDSEAVSVVWTREMAQAWGVACQLLQEGEMLAARQVFEETYAQAVLMARCQREPVSWIPSLGTDPVQREQVLREAVKKERLSASYVEQLLPYRSLSLQARHLLTQVRIKHVS